MPMPYTYAYTLASRPQHHECEPDSGSILVEPGRASTTGQAAFLG